MSTLYHGSSIEVKTPRTDAGRRNQEIIDKHLHFTGSYIIKDQD